MKPVTIIFFAVIVAVNAQAQIGKGKNVLSGSIYFVTNSNSSSGSSYETDYSNLRAMPTYGYFFGEKTEAGISIGYSWTNEKSSSFDPYSSYSYTSESTTGLFLAGPYIKFYQNLAERFYFSFSITSTFYTGSKETISSYPYPSSPEKTEYDIFEYQMGIAPGLVYFFNNHWATNISLGLLNYDSYKKTNASSDVSTTTNIFSAGINVGGFGFGIGYYF